ncbi:MAG TPA: hypothetical protein VHK88_13485 [Aquihabitans sp.]|jgi:hypothetical protein|nr:hypothetical protein [Aquihabitans sp.]
MGAAAAVIGLVVVVLVVALVVAGVAALRQRSTVEREAQLAPGLSTGAPASWAGSHDPEARLHRRLRDALAALRANQAFDDDGSMLDLRVQLEQEAVALDEQLVATAALPMRVRRDPLEKLTAAVETIEQAVADLAGASAETAAARLRVALDDVGTRTDLVAQARAALDALDDQGSATAPTPPASLGGQAQSAPPVAPPADPPPPVAPPTEPPTTDPPPTPRPGA